MGQTERGETPLEREAVALPEILISVAHRPVSTRRNGFRFQFGLRALIVLILVVGVASGILARCIARAKHQHEIVEELTWHRSLAKYDHGAKQGRGEYAAQGKYFWQQIDFWHNVIEVESDFFVPMQAHELKRIAELPALERLELRLDDRAAGSPLPRLACRNRLKHLRIWNRLCAGDANRIAECTSLTSLAIRVDAQSERELRVLDRLSNLTSLSILGQVTDEVLSEWKHMTNLKDLLLDDVSAISEPVLTSLLRRNSDLINIQLRSANATIPVCEALGECGSLKSLSLFQSTLNEDGLSKLQGLGLLENLSIPYTDVTGNALSGANSFPQLRHLDVAGTKITDTLVTKIDGELIEELILAETEVSPAPFRDASRWPNLAFLSLGKPAGSEAELEQVLQLPNLQRLLADGPVTLAFRQRHDGRYWPHAESDFEE
jgi:hypothetical protein